MWKERNKLTKELSFKGELLLVERKIILITNSLF